jgi:hypothetical protein
MYGITPSAKAKIIVIVRFPFLAAAGAFFHAAAFHPLKVVRQHSDRPAAGAFFKALPFNRLIVVFKRPGGLAAGTLFPALAGNRLKVVVLVSFFAAPCTSAAVPFMSEYTYHGSSSSA